MIVLWQFLIYQVSDYIKRMKFKLSQEKTVLPDGPISTPSPENKDIVAFHFCHPVKSTLDLERVLPVPDLVHKGEHARGDTSLDPRSDRSYIDVSGEPKARLEILINSKLSSEVVSLGRIVVYQISLEVERPDIYHAHVEPELGPCSFEDFHVDGPSPKAV